MSDFRKKHAPETQKPLVRRISLWVVGLKWAGWWRNAEWLIEKMREYYSELIQQWFDS